MNALILSWWHSFNVVDGIAELFANGLRENGANVVVANISTPEGVEIVFDAIRNNNIQLVIGMNIHAYNFLIDGERIFKLIDSKFAVFYMDHPVYSNDILDALLPDMPEDAMFMFCDSEQERHMRTYFNIKHDKKYKTVFFPYGTTPSFHTVTEGPEKKVDLIVFATNSQISPEIGLREDLYFKFPFHSAMPVEVLNKKIEIQLLADRLAISGFEIDLLGALEDLLNIEQLICHENYRSFLQNFDSYVKRCRRLKTIESLINVGRTSGLKIEVYGTGWDMLDSKGVDLKIYSPVPYSKQFDLYKRTKLVFNCDPNWGSGVHDRVFNAISSNCATLTNRNRYTDIYFRDEYDSLLYDSLIDLEAKVLIGVGMFSKISKAAATSILRPHSYKNRFAALLDNL